MRAAGRAPLADDQGQVGQRRGRSIGLQTVVPVGGQRGTLDHRLRRSCRLDTFEIGQGGGHRGALARGPHQYSCGVPQRRCRQPVVADAHSDLCGTRGGRHDQGLARLALETGGGQRGAVETEAARHGATLTHRHTDRIDVFRSTSGNVDVHGHARQSGGSNATPAK